MKKALSPGAAVSQSRSWPAPQPRAPRGQGNPPIRPQLRAVEGRGPSTQQRGPLGRTGRSHNAAATEAIRQAERATRLKPAEKWTLNSASFRDNLRAQGLRGPGRTPGSANFPCVAQTPSNFRAASNPRAQASARGGDGSGRKLTGDEGKGAGHRRGAGTEETPRARGPARHPAPWRSRSR